MVNLGPTREGPVLLSKSYYSCEHCVYYNQDHTHCDHPKGGDESIQNGETPDWCPLLIQIAKCKRIERLITNCLLDVNKKMDGPFIRPTSIHWISQEIAYAIRAEL